MDPLTELAKALRELRHENIKQFKELKKEIAELRETQSELLARMSPCNLPVEPLHENKVPETKEPYRDIEMYCTNCFELRPILEASKVRMPDGSPAIRGKCSICGAALFRMMNVSGVLVNDAAASRLGLEI